jgi:hypothetical protein
MSIYRIVIVIPMNNLFIQHENEKHKYLPKYPPRKRTRDG